MSDKNIILPAEWHKQQAIQLTWPHSNSDWNYLLEEVERCFVNIAAEISKRQQLIVVCAKKSHVSKLLKHTNINNISFFEIQSNDTWARDHGGITVFENGKPVLYDFCFNGWGEKFTADLDNQITHKLHKEGAFKNFLYSNQKQFILEGGSIESDGCGSLLTTEQCLLSANRNDSYSKVEIENQLKEFFGVEQIHWLKNGYLAGDDTDSHIDTLARFCNEKTIAYIKCKDKNDEHFEALSAMEKELKALKQPDGSIYDLLPLPMAEAVFDPDDGHRLPATYANFLIINQAVLFPVYNIKTDSTAIEAISKAFPDKEIVPIDCSVLIRQHGSLHCITMQYPEPLKQQL
ncbi:MAG: agmatine deiminase family protein [Prolixibacteraceae bacterium]|jgi:agmatine deiminase|nr:agmatine deiminase family protein [Prolixibacteraceae bacterium]